MNFSNCRTVYMVRYCCHSAIMLGTNSMISFPRLDLACWSHSSVWDFYNKLYGDSSLEAQVHL